MIEMIAVVAIVWIAAGVAIGALLHRVSDCYRPFQRRRV